jgi:hypothetical protein
MINTTRNPILVGLVGASFGLSSSVVIAKSYVAVPEVDWEDLVPYVRANIVPELNDTCFDVFVCPDHTNRSVATPFDEALSDFTRVLITQSMRTDSKVSDAVASATEEFRRRVPKLEEGDRASYRELFWQSLSESTSLLQRLKSAFLAAQGAGRLRCWLCEKDPSYAPSARRVSSH